jgi:hypothetical protein
MTIIEAKKAVFEYIEVQSRGSFTPKIIDEHTIDMKQGWIFFYDSQEFLETKDFSYAIAGNGPIAVAKKTGMIYGNLKPSIDIEAIVADFASRLPNSLS